MKSYFKHIVFLVLHEGLVVTNTNTANSKNKPVEDVSHCNCIHKQLDGLHLFTYAQATQWQTGKQNYKKIKFWSRVKHQIPI